MLFFPSKSSCSYTAAGGSLHVTAPRVSLEQAEKLEGGNVKEAFAIYESLVGESPEAGYRCGLMLLEGRGTTRNLWQAYKCLKWAAGQGHSEASEVLSKIEKKMYWVEEIATRLSKTGMNDDGTLKITPELQHDLQHGMRMLILSDKNRIDIENSLITWHDITEAIDDITGHAFWQGHPGNAALQDCLKKVAESFPLMKEGATDVASLIMTEKQQLVMVEVIMNIKDKNHKQDTEKWTITFDDLTDTVFNFNKKERKFLTPVWLHKEKVETYWQNRMASLLAEGIASYNHSKQACVGMVIQENQLPTDVLTNIFHLLPPGALCQLTVTSQLLSQRGKEVLQQPAWWLNKLQDEVIVPPVLPSKSKESESQPLAAKTFFLENPGKRKDCYLTQDKAGKAYLKEQGINDAVLFNLIGDGLISLADCLALPPLTDFGRKTLNCSRVRKWLGEGNNLSHLRDIMTSTWESLQSVMQNKWMRDGIASGKLLVVQLTNLKRVEVEMLLNPEVQKWLDEGTNLSYLPDMINITSVNFATDRTSVSSYFFTAMRNKWVREGITNGTLTVDQLTKLKGAGFVTLLSPKMQKWLDESNDSSYLSHIMNVSSRVFQQAICNEWVRARLTGGQLNIKELTSLSGDMGKVLLDREVQEWLDKDNNLSHFPNIMNFINCFLKAVHSKPWVIERLASGELTSDELKNAMS